MKNDVSFLDDGTSIIWRYEVQPKVAGPAYIRPTAPGQMGQLDYSYRNQQIFDMIKWCCDIFGENSAKIRWRCVGQGGPFQFVDEEDARMFQLAWCV